MIATSSRNGRGLKPLLLAIALSAGLHTGATLAQTAAPAPQTIDIPAGNLSQALDRLGEQTGVLITYEPGLVQGLNAPRVSGQLSAKEALSRLLRSSGIQVEAVNEKTFVLRRAAAASPAPPAGQAQRSAPRREAQEEPVTQDMEKIAVTGTRIRGAKDLASPLTVITREEMKQSGHNDLGEVIRALPQNFAGGQNPTIAGGGQGGFTNVSGSSALNLRGLGPDASLTLLNGHRTPFDAVSQGVDISAIPIAAIDRIDVVTDGASAIYGSDAVGGVANVILRRNVEGVVTSARLGVATDGGAETQQYSIVAGPKWSTGGLMLAADYQRSMEINARERSYSSNLPSDATLIPGQKQVSLIMAGQQRINDSTTFDIDGHYMDRSTSRCMTAIITTSCFNQGNAVLSTVDGWSVTPSLSMDFSSGWNLRLSGTYGESDTSVVTQFYAGGSEVSRALPNYINDLKSIELGAEGALFSLPGGNARLAVGAGYRSNSLRVDSRRFVGGIESPIDIFEETQRAAFGYGELFLPLVSPDNQRAFAEKLHLIGALRYEDHRDIGRVTTPKLGIVYTPTESVEFKASWGESFKAPTLYQTGQTSNAQLLPGFVFSPAPESTDPVLYIFGGNRNLTPERAKTMTVSAAINPEFLEGFRAEASYYRIRYRDRVAPPFSPITSALLPVFSDFVQLNPTANDVLAAIGSITGSFENSTGQPFSSDAVSAILDNRLQNISLQSIDGVDANFSYVGYLRNHGSLTIKGLASYLDSTRRVTDNQSPTQNSGLIFKPPHWRGRVSIGWELDNVSITATGNYIGETDDNRQQPIVKVDAFTTLDTVLMIRGDSRSDWLDNIDFTISVLNLFNKKPVPIRFTDPAALRYDSLNHSTFGRVINITVSKGW